MYRPSVNELALTSMVDDRLIAAMRLILASSALLIICLDPSEPDRYVPITYTALIIYVLYSAVLYFLAVRHSPTMHWIRKWSYWADVCWYLILISLSSGTSSIFFFFFFFSILVASFRFGFAAGLRVVIVSSLLFTIIGYATAPSGPRFELNRFLLRPIYLLVLGYMMAYWGGFEIMLKRRLALLKEVSLLSNPRFGINRTIGEILQRLRGFYDVDACVLIMTELNTDQYHLYRAVRSESESATRYEVVGMDLAQRFLTLPPEVAVTYGGEGGSWWPGGGTNYTYDVIENERRDDDLKECQRLATLLDAVSFATAPLLYRNAIVGRIFLTSNRRHSFNRSDAEFLIHVFEQVMPVIENIRLVDRLASDAADNERQRIALDIHDSVIQPYIGLQMGLAAIEKKASKDGATVGDDIKRLMELTYLSISNLRSYTRGLKSAGDQAGGLLPSVRRFAAKFSEATGITIKVESDSGIQINDRLAAEAFQIIAEGLSNIRRHTEAKQATIKIADSDNRLLLRIENDLPDGEKPKQFTPRSITDRARGLGGQVQVQQHDSSTVVLVRIPL